MQVTMINNKHLFSLWFYRYALDGQALWEFNNIVPDILKVVPFNLAVKYDMVWTHMGGDPLPYNEFEAEEINSYLHENGKILNSVPLVWRFHKNEYLSNIIFGFLNADKALVANSLDEIDLDGMPIDGSDENILEFWGENSHYFLASLADYVGLCFVSKIKEKIDEIERKLIPSIGNQGIIKAKGDKIIGGSIQDKSRWGNLE